MWILPEYKYATAEIGHLADASILTDLHEAELVEAGLKEASLKAETRLCIDITGFMRPHILFFMKYLKGLGCKSVDMLYTEPEHYTRKAETAFSLDEVIEVRQVAGFEGVHTPDMSNDVLILGGGYDHNLMGRVILGKENARLVHLHGFPSLSADMYHESLLRLDRVSFGSARAAEDLTAYSSANDPFVTASILSETYGEIASRKPISNLYLASLATKPQAVGFGLFYLRELEGTASSIIFPYFGEYSKETSKGIGRTWVYPISL